VFVHGQARLKPGVRYRDLLLFGAPDGGNSDGSLSLGALSGMITAAVSLV